ncbi:LPXTG cell wall anchor domain-containing protein [Kitasatospora brasiliensis]|uniref:LPXTG cell wall anchor domain-containing protein n=1 Tax=Kitasatospora brasiliensis TaxID=3058040 RepID=UPI002931F6A6|nr:LPXTG cell wall anchor domain-containing protein [Kitasatospora sp. K002]
MRTSVITRFAKNDRSVSGRRRIALLAATTVLAGGMQLLATDTAWACGPSDAEAAGVTASATAPSTAPTATTTGAAKAPATGTAKAAPAAAPKAPAATHQGTYQSGFHMTPDHQTITAGGPKVEIGVSVANFTGAPYQNVSAMLGIYDAGTGYLDPKNITVEVASAGGWKPVKMVADGCDPSMHTAATAASTTARLENGRAANFMFRVGVSAKAPKQLTELGFVTLSKATGFPTEMGDHHTFHVAHPSAPAPAPTGKPTTPAKPAPKPTKETQPAPAKPAADTTKDAAPAATPTAPPATAAPVAAAPATTAPAGTPELAHTGSSSGNTFLALTAAALLALGAGVLVAVRRLRPQR